MSRTLPPLPYAMDALEPHISAETLDFHYNKHHASYLNKLNTLTKGGEHEDVSVGDLVRKGQKTLPASIYNNAAQVWNHTFYWMSLAPTSTPTEPSSRLMSMIDNSFGSMDDFQRKFSEIAAGHFGSGWAWLVQNSDGMLEIKDTHDAVSIWSGMFCCPCRHYCK